MKICVFEDQTYENLFPLALTRGVFELKCGYVSLLDRIKRNFPQTDIGVFMRDYLVPTARKRLNVQAINDYGYLKGDDILFINGKALLEYDKLELNGPEEIGLSDDEVVYVRAKKETVENCMSRGTEEAFKKAIKEALPKKDIDIPLISYLWNTIQHNPEVMEWDFEYEGKDGIHGTFASQASLWPEDCEDNVFVAETAEIQPHVVLDASEGPIYIDEGVVVNPHTRIEGPAYIGKDTRVVGGKIREGCSIGPVCRVGGEVEESIIHGYSNKYHDGFLGHAYVGEWVNLGALTTNSDLKNDYSSVQVYVKGNLVDTQDTKVGSFIGDHTKTALSTLFTTGTVVGIMSNVMPSGELLPKLIPSFCWYFRNKFSRGRGLKSFLETAEIAMGRRDVALTDEDVELFEKLYEITKEERDDLIKKTRRKK